MLESISIQFSGLPTNEINLVIHDLWTFLTAQAVNNLCVMQETQVQFLGQKDPLEKEMTNHSAMSCLENAMDRGAWQATVHGVARVGHYLVTKPPP